MITMNVDEHTNNAIEIVSEGTKLTSQLLLFILKTAVDMLEDKNKDKMVIDGTTKRGKQKINDLIKKHKDGIESLDGNLTREQLKDYQKELKKLGVDFSIVKNGKDNYSFFFAGEQSNIIEKALKNVLEQKSHVLNDEKVKEAELDLNAEKHNFTEKEVDKVKKIYDNVSEKISLSKDEKENIRNEIDKLNIGNSKAYDSINAYDKTDKYKILLKNTKDNTWGDGDLKVEIDKETGKSNVYKNEIDGENWGKSEYKIAKRNVDLNIDLSKSEPIKENIKNEPEVSNLSDKEKILINKMNRLDAIEKEVQNKIKILFQDLKEEINIGKENNLDGISKDNEKENKIEFAKNKTENPIEDKEFSPTTKEESKNILNQKLSQLDDKQLDLFVQRMTYENEATSPVFDSTKTYLEANKLTEMQKEFPKETIQKINNLDSEIRNLNNFDSRTKEVRNNPKLTAKEILKETKEHQKQRENKREDKVKDNVLNIKKYSIQNIKKIDQEIKAEDKNKPVVRNKEQSL